MSKRLAKPVEAISEIKQLEASVPPGVIHQANHLNDRLIRKSVNRRTHGAARLGKQPAATASQRLPYRRQQDTK